MYFSASRTSLFEVFGILDCTISGAGEGLAAAGAAFADETCGAEGGVLPVLVGVDEAGCWELVEADTSLIVALSRGALAAAARRANASLSTASSSLLPGEGAAVEGASEAEPLEVVSDEAAATPDTAESNEDGSPSNPSWDQGRSKPLSLATTSPEAAAPPV
jgi:hypothetical protein